MPTGHAATEEAAGMIEMAAEGHTQREIAEETGRNLRTVNKTIRTANKTMKGRPCYANYLTA